MTTSTFCFSLHQEMCGSFGHSVIFFIPGGNCPLLGAIAPLPPQMTPIAYEFLFVFRSNYGPVLNRFRDKARCIEHRDFSHTFLRTPRRKRLRIFSRCFFTTEPNPGLAGGVDPAKKSSVNSQVTSVTARQTDGKATSAQRLLRGLLKPIHIYCSFVKFQ